MNTPKRHCIRDTMNSTEILQENRSKIVIQNAARILFQIVTIDGCEIDDHQNRRCDYLVCVAPRKRIFVELKGSDITHAITQLEATIVYFRISPACALELQCIVVTAQRPRIDSRRQIEQKRFFAQHAAMLNFYSSPHTIVIC
jgi:hypothetical protein